MDGPVYQRQFLVRPPLSLAVFIPKKDRNFAGVVYVFADIATFYRDMLIVTNNECSSLQDPCWRTARHICSDGFSTDDVSIVIEIAGKSLFQEEDASNR
jgi:hypothetical protein